MAMHPGFRFAIASLASALAALVLLGLLLPIYVAASSGVAPSSEEWLASLFLLPFVIFVGGMFALPAAAVAGGLVLLWQRLRAACLPLWGWLIAGAATGAVMSVFFGQNDDLPARLAAAVWFCCAGAMGAWAFRRVWGLKRLHPRSGSAEG